MYEFKYCANLIDLRKFLDEANTKGYEIVCMTDNHGYTIIYKIK